MRKLAIIVCTLLLAFLFSACDHTQLEPLTHLTMQAAQPPPPVGTAVINFATMPALRLAGKLKFVFVVDESGSNEGTPGQTPGTDPLGNRRFVAMENFITTLEQQQQSLASDIFFSLITFNTTATKVSDFTNNPTNFVNQAIQSQLSQIHQLDKGFTDYLGAEALVTSLIQADITNTQSASTGQTGPAEKNYYVVIFESDGAPAMPDPNTIQGWSLEPTTNILSGIDGILGLANQPNVEGITFNTGMYYQDQPEAGAIPLLTAMAQEGNGLFYNFGPDVGQPIDYSRYPVPLQQVKYQIRDIVGHNVNTVWFQGQLQADSDGDGLPDVLEQQLGSDPNNPDTDGDGISDGVQYLLTQTPCATASCAPVQTNLHSACDQYMVSGTGSGSAIKFASSPDSRMNRCELTLLGADPNSWDGSQEWIPNYLKLVNGLSFDPTAPDAQLDPDQDGVINYNEVKFDTPVMTSNSLVQNLTPYQYDLQLVNSTSTQDFYQLTISNIPLGGPSDRFRVYIMEQAPAVDETRYMLVAEKPFQNGAVDFENGDFQ